MGYSDQKFQARSLERYAYITGTATASGANACTGADLKTDAQPVNFTRRSVINKIQIVNNIAVPSNWTGVNLIIKNGTNTVATQTMTGTAGEVDSPAVTAANATFSAGSGPTFTWSGTSTASGQSIGTSVVWFEVQELPS